MSTEDIRIHKAIVHSVDALSGISHVKIPAVTGQKIVPVSTEGLTQSSQGVWNVPRVGDLVLVALARDNTSVSWVSGMYADLYRGDVNGVIEAINAWDTGDLQIDEPGALATDLIISRHILAGQIISDKIAANAITAIKIDAGAITTEKLDAQAVTAEKIEANTITTNELSADAIQSTNYLPPGTGGEYKQQRWSESSATYLTWTGTTIETEIDFFAPSDVGRPMVVAYSDNPYPSGPDSGAWIDFLPFVTITSYVSPQEVVVDTNVSAAPDLEWIGYLILPSSIGSDFAARGSFFDLANGNLITTGFLLDGDTGGVRVRGAISATEMAVVHPTTFQAIWSIEEDVAATPFGSLDGYGQFMFTKNDEFHSVSWGQDAVNQSIFALTLDTPRVTTVTDLHVPLEGLQQRAALYYFGRHDDVNNPGIEVGDSWTSILQMTPGQLPADYGVLQPFFEISTSFFPDDTIAVAGTAISRAAFFNNFDSGFEVATSQAIVAGVPSGSPVNTATITAATTYTTGVLSVLSGTGSLELGQWSGGGDYRTLDGPAGYLILSGNATTSANSPIYLRSKGTGTVNLGADDGNDLILSTTDITAALPIHGPAGSVGAPSFAFSTDPDTGIYSTGSGQFGFSGNGVQSGRIAVTFVELKAVWTTATAGTTEVRVINSNGQLGYFSSSIKTKTDVEDMDLWRAEQLIDNLRPIWYRSTNEVDNPDWGHYGLIAEEVVEIDPVFTGLNDEDGSPRTVDYTGMVTPLIALVQDLRKRVAELESA